MSFIRTDIQPVYGGYQTGCARGCAGPIVIYDRYTAATKLVVQPPELLGGFCTPERVRQVQGSRVFAVVAGLDWIQVFTKGSVKLMVQTLQKNIRVTPGQWKRIEKETEERGISPNQLLVELAMEALDHGGWPRTEHEIQLLRSAMFAAQAMARDMERAGRGEEVEEISRNISEVVPELPSEPIEPEQDQPHPSDTADDNA